VEVSTSLENYGINAEIAANQEQKQQNHLPDKHAIRAYITT